MTIRDKPIYISHDVWRALWLLSKATPVSEDKIPTPDELADALLRLHIEKNRPELFEHQKKLEKLDNDLIASLQKK